MDQIQRPSPNERSPPGLNYLPDEVIQQILAQLDWSSLLSVSAASRHLHAVADEQLIWKELVLKDFLFWDSKYDIGEKKDDSSFYEWKQLYAVRHTANIATRKAIDLLINNPLNRLSTATRILDHGYGIKDELLRLYHNASANPDCVLAQRYWAQTLLACINRSRALEAWSRLKFRSDVANSAELALAGLDMFVLSPDDVGDIDDTFRRLDSYARAVRDAYPDLDEQTPRTKAITIARFLRDKKWVGIDEGRDYYSLENQFIGLSLRSTLRNSLPLISCVIYCYVARQFNLRAQPCSYPMHVHAVVQPPAPRTGEDPVDLDNQPLSSDHASDLDSFRGSDVDHELPSEQTHVYVDPFNTHEPIPLASLTQQLQFVAPQATPSQRARYLLPADARSLLVRSAHNIIRSLQHTPFDQVNPNRDPNDPEINSYDAAYAALFALVMCSSSQQVLASSVQDLQSFFANHFTEDLRNYETYVLPLTTGLGTFGGSVGIRDPYVAAIRAEDSRPKRPKRRANTPTENIEGERETIKFRVGTVFRHRRQGYTAVIYGWDGRCEMEERWIVGNGVDRLPRGRAQPFYNAYVDDRTTRYVAQENVIPLGPDEFTAEDAERSFSVEVGKWFLRFDPVTARFVSNIRDEYPED